MPADKPRFMHNTRDMAMSLIPLVALCLFVAAVAGRCSFSPGGPTQGKVPHYDAAAALRADASQLTFPIRDPKVPQGWQPNSGGHATIDGNDGGVATNVGYITPNRNYIKFVQSNAQPAALVDHVAGNSRGVTGTRNIAGQTWSIYAQQGAEPIWVDDLGNVRLLLTGSGTDAEFADLATAAQAATPIKTD